MGPQNLALQVQEVRERVARAVAAAGRSAHSVTLLAVGKAQPLALLRAAADAGLTDFGESYLNEALEKVAALQDRALTWHYIGRLQANKTRPVAEAFAWVHAVDRLKIAERLSAQRPFDATPLNVCLQLHVGGEASKGGAEATEIAPLAMAIRDLPSIKLRGLMCMPPAETDIQRQREWFRETRQVFDYLNERGLGLDTLSMGTSVDFEAAIAEGATIVRVGTAIFGPRSPQP